MLVGLADVVVEWVPVVIIGVVAVDAVVPVVVGTPFVRVLDEMELAVLALEVVVPLPFGKNRKLNPMRPAIMISETIRVAIFSQLRSLFSLSVKR